MSPRTKVTREEWIASTTGLLDQGRVPADLTLLDLCTRMGVTKGSLYSHFSGLQDLYAEVIGRYLRDSPTNGLASSMQAIHGPLDRLRLLRARALETAQRDSAMRRWAEYEPAAAAAMAQVDSEVAVHVTTALRDLGLPGEEAAVMADVLMSAFAYHAAPAPPRADPATFETLLAILARAATAPRRTTEGDEEVDVTAGVAQGEVVLVTHAKGLPEAERREKLALAQQFAGQVPGLIVHGVPRSHRPAVAETGGGTPA
jgi:AcrR family transcriptional regulator